MIDPQEVKYKLYHGYKINDSHRSIQATIAVSHVVLW